MQSAPMTMLPAESESPDLSGWKGVLLALAVCGAVTAVALPIRTALDHANVVMAYLLGVSLIAMWLGRLPAVVAAVASVILFDFFFVEPRFSLAVEDAQYLITFLVMLIVGLIIAALTARLRWEAQRAAAREARARALYRLALDISGALDVHNVDGLIASFLNTEFGIDAKLLLVDTNGAFEAASGGAPSPPVFAMAKRVLELGDALPFVEPATGVASLVLPLNAPRRRRGVLLVQSRERDVVVTGSQRPLLDAVAALASTAIERIHFADVARDTEVEIESERLRTSVLSAVSHDLRTPLTMVVGLADVLARGEAMLPPELRGTAADLREQAMRLSRMVENLLDMARLRAGRVHLLKAWQPVEEVVGSSVHAVEANFPGRAIGIDLAPELPLLEFDGVLIERVLVNLLDNAMKHAPGSPVTISGRVQGGEVTISVEDRGPGLPVEDTDRLFDMFEQGDRESQAVGTGMGLAICKAIVHAHGGRIEAASREGGGARFTMSLPVTTPPAALQASLAQGEAVS
jgi:two-component system, OmpR family, sensor histidine kinase KdpD